MMERTPLDEIASNQILDPAALEVQFGEVDLEPHPFSPEELEELADLLIHVSQRLSDTTIDFDPRTDADRIGFAAFRAVRESIYALRLVAEVIS